MNWNRTIQRCLSLVLLLAAAAPCAAGVHVALVPSTSAVAPSAEFTIQLRVTEAGTAFNAYDATIAFDAAALTFLPASPPSLQEGQAMQNACANRFHLFSSSPITITHGLLCSGVTLTGPGELYVLRFRASDRPQFATVQVSNVGFYESGYTVAVSSVTDAVIQISSPTDAPPRAYEIAARIRSWPNPFNPATRIEVESPAGGRQSLLVHDARGRLVRVLEAGSFEAGTRIVPWDGRDQSGSPLASGVYTLVLRTPGAAVTHRLVMLK